ncbi:MAG: zinc ribbon domain-containing protein [Holophagales bacterium]|nr:zinc ribbon domain-containing protein [Holophagales bacterium]
MPVYEYRCRACGKKTEDLVLAGDAAGYVPECAHCGSGDLGRLLSTFAAHGGDKSSAPSTPPLGDGPLLAGRGRRRHGRRQGRRREGGGGGGGGGAAYDWEPPAVWTPPRRER